MNDLTFRNTHALQKAHSYDSYDNYNNFNEKILTCMQNAVAILLLCMFVNVCQQAELVRVTNRSR